MKVSFSLNIVDLRYVFLPKSLGIRVISGCRKVFTVAVYLI